MFIQIIQGRCSRQDELHSLMDEWRTQMADSAVGWLGGTYGFTDDDQFVGVVRFESREKAMQNSALPETSAFADRMRALMDGPLEYHDCDDVTLMMDGGSDAAGFVQVIRGRVQDRDSLKAMMADTEVLHRERPEIIGATLAIEEDGTFTETVAFTTEADARVGEKKEMPEMPASWREAMDTALQGAQFYDLHHPWFESR